MNVYKPLWDALIAAPNFPLKDFTPPDKTGVDRDVWVAVGNVWKQICKPGEVAEGRRIIGDHHYELNTDPSVCYTSYPGQTSALLGFIAIYCGADRKAVNDADFACYQNQVAMYDVKRAERLAKAAAEPTPKPTLKEAFNNAQWLEGKR